MGPRNAIVAGLWFLLREVEPSTTRTCMLTIVTKTDCTARATWRLPASKADQAAMGVARSHFCSCPPKGSPRPSCPVHALWDQVLLLRRLFPEKFVGQVPTRDLPLSRTCRERSSRRSE